MKIIREEFASVGDRIKAAKRDRSRLSSATSNHCGLDWYGGVSFEEAVSLAENGWPEGAAKVAKLAASIVSRVTAHATSSSTAVQYDVTGQWVDIGLFLSNEPDCFGYECQDESRQAAPVVRLAFNCSSSASVTAEKLTERGIIAAAAIDVLESAGRRVEVLLLHGEQYFSGEKQYQSVTRLKDASQPLDIDKVAFALGHAATLRRIGFACAEVNGLSIGSCRPCAVPVDGEAILVDHLLRHNGLSNSDLESQVLSICAACGLSIEGSNE
jgi:hypothetical protein